MSGKCRPSLTKTLEKLELCVKLHQISVTDYECVKAAFKRLEERGSIEETDSPSKPGTKPEGQVFSRDIYYCTRCGCHQPIPSTAVHFLPPRCPICDVAMERMG
mgnify:CR=1 FL=1